MNETRLWFACHARELQLTLPYPGGELKLALDQLPADADDVELTFEVPGYTLHLRRVHCVINDGLLSRGESQWELRPQTRAALLWRAFRRYREFVGLKRLSGGLSGNDVLVFRPRLQTPRTEDPKSLASSGPLDVLDGSWGSPLLVKTGPSEDIFREWNRSETFLRDRRSPFLARNEDYLDVQPPGPPETCRLATMISSFLGGELIQAEPFDKLVRGSRDSERCLRVIDQIAIHLDTWHANSVSRPLVEWPRVFRFADNLPPPDWTTAPWLAFGRFNFRKARLEREGDRLTEWDIPRPDGRGRSLGRAEFAVGVGWDIPFGKGDHLQRHLLGSLDKRDGLLYRLAAMPVQFSLIHGDLNPRNILCDADRVWFIDFEKTGVGPVLADLARLEVNLRLWCISLAPAKDGVAEFARRLEHLLLDHFYESESSLEPVREFAEMLGADPDDLEKIARCIVHIRRLARKRCVPEFTDGRDYLAILYLTVLGLLPLAGQGHTTPGNERWAVELCWVLEETLDRLLNRKPFDREQRPYDPLYHVSAELLRAPDASHRVHHLCSTSDGREALQPVVALQGILQGVYHHLDAYQHTLSVLTYLEAIIDQPVESLLAPARLDSLVAERLREYGITTHPPHPIQTNPLPVDAPWFAPYRAQVESFLRATLTDEAKLVLKWSALLHDVGKPGTRTISERAGGLDVQFLGHERYGVALLRSRLAMWFPSGDPHQPINPVGLRLSDLIRNHHRSHQLLGDHFYRESERLANLYGLLAVSPQPEMLAWLRGRFTPGQEEYRPDMPLLLLHGYADRLSARGLRQGGSVSDWATGTLALLTYLARQDEFLQAEAERVAAGVPSVTAAQAYVAELLEGNHIKPEQRNRVMGILRAACAGRAGTANELLQHLRETHPREDIVQRLDGSRKG